MLEGQRAGFRPAGGARVTALAGGSAVAVEGSAAGGASRPPSAHGHRSLATTLWLSPQLQAPGLPYRPVPRPVPRQGMGDLVQDRIADQALVVAAHERQGKLDAFGAVDAQSHGLSPAIKPKLPACQSMLLHELPGKFGGVPCIHAG